MPKHLLVSYDPESHLEEDPLVVSNITASESHVALTVRAVDENIGAPVGRIVTSFTTPGLVGNLIDGPNDLNFTTNRPQSITLTQVDVV